MQRLRFFMDLSGNTELLDRPLVAFFASRKATPRDAQLARQWAESICQTDKVVISGFHSPLEKEILNYLLERHHPVIFALGRALYKNIPLHLQAAFDEGNLLFISFRGYTRHSWNSAQQRNWGAADLASEICFTQFDNTSSLSTLHFTLDRYSDKAVYVLRWLVNGASILYHNNYISVLLFFVTLEQNCKVCAKNEECTIWAVTASLCSHRR